MDKVGLGEAGHGDHFHRRVAFGDRRGGGDVVHAGHQQVHQHHIRWLTVRDERRDPLQGLLPVGCLTNHLHVVHHLQIGTQASADHGVVVNYEHPDAPLGHGLDPMADRSGRLYGDLGHLSRQACVARPMISQLAPVIMRFGRR
jgi:hypothetical protein